MAPMEAFHARCPEIGWDEYRSLNVRGDPNLPDGEYGFVELYCNEPGCDCRRMLICVLAPHLRKGPVATFNYGWESADFYRKWSVWISSMAEEMAGLSAEPFGEQSEYSGILFEYFRTVLEDPHYVERLKRHYALFKKAIAARPARAPSRGAKPSRRKKRRRDKNKKRRKG